MGDYVILTVNPDGDQVKFFLFSARGDGQRVFSANFCSARSGHVYHLHRKFSRGGEENEMTVTLFGSNKAAIFCQACGLRIIILENGMSAEELRLHFSRR